MIQPLSGSFRDPGNFVYKKDGVIYRQINKDFTSNYRHLIDSGLYSDLADLNLLIKHNEVSDDYAANIDSAGIVLCPEQITFITYPYEWCFSQLQDAALLTLDICIKSIEFGMILQDASSYNVQFHKGKPVFIDTGSFVRYKEGDKWEGYQQFCKHFLSPLLLASKVDIRLMSLTKTYIDGPPLDLVSKLLPRKSWLSWSILSHIHLHAITQNRYADKGEAVKKTNKISKNGMLGLLDNLKSTVINLEWNKPQTEWGDYYNATNYTDDSTLDKNKIVLSLAHHVKPSLILDLGANNGFYSHIVAETGASVVSADIDPVAVEENYRGCMHNSETQLLPIMQDLTSPSPGIGWGNVERNSLESRADNVDLVMALALVHHMAISNNVPLSRIAQYFSSLGRYLIIEFIPKGDSQVKKLFLSRTDIFPKYCIDEFEFEFQKLYKIINKSKIINSERIIYLMKLK
jgi:2-polyprenyl-3-methyl-5-hydroxy-6-metoxy-1,4-benzoquinol methylase